MAAGLSAQAQAMPASIPVIDIGGDANIAPLRLAWRTPRRLDTERFRAEQAALHMYKPANFGVGHDATPVTRPELFEVPFCRKVAVVRLSVLKGQFFKAFQQTHRFCNGRQSFG